MNEIRDRINKLREKGVIPFGYTQHRLELKPPLDEIELRKIESIYSVDFPEDYRSFIINVANGGAGPGYGLLSLSDAISYQRKLIPTDILKRPFNHVSRFVPQPDPEIKHIHELCDQGLLSDTEVDTELDNRLCYITSGTVVLCDEGCGYMHRLIVSGPSKGEVWLDAQESSQGLHSLEVTFISWYMKWIIDIEQGGSGAWWLQKL